MWDILKALAGRRTCPWCQPAPDPEPVWTRLYRSFYDKLPRRLVRLMFPYDNAVFRVGGGWHRKFHVKEEPQDA